MNSVLGCLEVHTSLTCTYASSKGTHASKQTDQAFRHSRCVYVRCAINRILRDKDMLHNGYYESCGR